MKKLIIIGMLIAIGASAQNVQARTYNLNKHSIKLSLEDSMNQEELFSTHYKNVMSNSVSRMREVRELMSEFNAMTLAYHESIKVAMNYKMPRFLIEEDLETIEAELVASSLPLNDGIDLYEGTLLMINKLLIEANAKAYLDNDREGAVRIYNRVIFWYGICHKTYDKHGIRKEMRKNIYELNSQIKVLGGSVWI